MKRTVLKLVSLCIAAAVVWQTAEWVRLAVTEWRRHLLVHAPPLIVAELVALGPCVTAGGACLSYLFWRLGTRKQNPAHGFELLRRQDPEGR